MNNERSGRKVNSARGSPPGVGDSVDSLPKMRRCGRLLKRRLLAAGKCVAAASCTRAVRARVATAGTVVAKGAVGHVPVSRAVGGGARALFLDVALSRRRAADGGGGLERVKRASG